MKYSILFLLLLLFSENRAENAENNICEVRPASCNLLCPFGYLRDVLRQCTCTCAIDPCQTTLCAPSDSCIAVGHKARCIPKFGSHRDECPRLTGGVCALRCEKDSDCNGRLICCSNGCGRECVAPIGAVSFPIKAEIVPKDSLPGSFHRLIKAVSNIALNSTPFPPTIRNIANLFVPSTLPIRPEIVQTIKVGQCPAPDNGKQQCEAQQKCANDLDCPNVDKCCPNSCGATCMEPLKATACIHMVLAISKLPEKRLPNEYVPYCERNGRFSNIQCDLKFCWCVDVHYGTEIEGTRINKDQRRIEMCQNPRLCAHKCYNQCAHGYQMDSFGCPVATCKCQDICENVKCDNTWEHCQLVEPDCANPPCLPVPRCLLNPCKSGVPNKLSNGITALCSSNKDCSATTSTCFRIGYNGLGFCCSGVDASTKEGRCPSKPASANCVSGPKCNSDVECPNDEKCCFNGCTLSCTIPEGYSSSTRNANRISMMFQPGEIEKYNKGHLTSLVADCTDQVVSNNTCLAECHSDMQCSGMKRCCRQGCSTTCMYPVRSTPCFHLALTAELYSLRTAMKCDRAGNFEQFQCDDEGCFCADIVTGDPIPGTKIIGRKPNCEAKNPCDPIVCKSECPYGFEKGPNFCPTCKCKNPCETVKCPQGSVCVMSSVQCYQNTNCHPQPRCVINFCPTGDPYVSQVGNIESCSKDEECPFQTHWCHSMGLSSGGLCCPIPTRTRNPGSCPTVPISLDARMCKIMCRVDDDCKSYQKCCFDGCGATCKDITTPLVELTKENFEKPGTCILEQQQRVLCNRLEKNTCEFDSDCAGVAKCCDDGCVKSCQYPLQTSKCLVRKTNLQKMGQMDLIKCRPDGSFEQIQCDQDFCWCVDEDGNLVDGTRTGEDITPNCPTTPTCDHIECDGPICLYGRKKDSKGCAYCECIDPCEGVSCPEEAVCIPTSTPCVTKPCPTVPKCIINPCPNSEIVRNSTSLGPKRCSKSYDCYDRLMTTHCSMITESEGFCCTAEQPEKTHSGTCPKITSITTSILESCIQGCKSDEDCDTDSKCCWNGCGLTCVTTTIPKIEPQHHNMKDIHIGECLKVAPLGAFCMQRTSMADCKTDQDCPSLYKCCSDGCVMRCSQPHKAPLCVHQRITALAMQEISHDEDLFIPECDATTGHFDEIQSHFGLMWCVNEVGREIVGTKSTTVPNCDQPRKCAQKPCDKNCPYGYNTDNDGCPVCDCISPCDFVDCPAGNVCRLVPVKCSSDTPKEECLPIAKCIPNMCATGEPFALEFKRLAGCSPCPAGFYCKNSGYGDISICCPAPEPPQNSLKCPNLQTMLASVDGSSCVVGCRHHSDCPNSSCCFNGCGTSCQFETSPITPTNFHKISVTKKPLLSKLKIERKASQITNVIQSVITTTTMLIPTKLGTCPNILLNPGCSEQCNQDNDCHGFYKCCTASCGTLCSAPRIATACIHRLIAFETRETIHPPAVQCSTDGLFRKYQCDVQINQCWCVDVNTGVEEIGTRMFNLGGLGPIDCTIPKLCAVRCEQSTCIYGVRLDHNGCPSNGACECNNICQTFQCPPLMECALKKVECTSHPCPDIPICVGVQQCPIPQRDIYRNPIICENDGSCGNNAKCQNGICCHQKVQTQSSVNLMVPVIVATPSVPETSLATNCSTMVTAFDKLVKFGAVIRGAFPKCSITGNYEKTQCDSKRCWCVDDISGQEIHGTRKKKLKNACKSQSLCFSKCSTSLCPYGLLLDSIGCPRPECICKSACENVDCPSGQVCILRQVDCGGKFCLPVPTCEPSPCNSGMKPLVEARTRQQYSCAQKNLVCPTGYYCTAYDNNMQGVCCPGTDSILSIGHNDGLTCPHGDPFSLISDGTPTSCTVKSNGCPSTHYCSTQASQKSGICCVSKRHVCNLLSDSGPCKAKVSRFFYSSKSHSCELFEYGGCAGNLNNFATRQDCENFCAGIGLDLSSPYDFATAQLPIESYQIAFSLTGQKIHAAKKLQAEKELTDTLVEKFRIPRGSIDDVTIRDDNTVKFTITDIESRQFARSISEQVSNGQLTMVLSGNTLKAEPHTLIAHHLADENMAKGTARVVFYAMLLASSIFLMCVICVFCFSCFCYYRNDTSKKQSTTPTTITENRSHLEEMHRVFSRDDVSVCSDLGARPEMMMRRSDRSQSWIG